MNQTNTQMDMMKLGRLLTWALVVAMPLWFGSCKKEGGGGDLVTPNSVEGSWKISGIKLKQGTQTQDYLEVMKQYVGEGVIDCLTDTKITFNSNSKITGVASPKCQTDNADDISPVSDTSTWKVTGNKLTITDGDGSTSTYDLTLNGGTMTWGIDAQEDLDGDGKNDNYTTIIEFKRA
ncbi:lipocalin family protein [Spirosoma sp. RP8]|uniref:Lipocalin family protein n=1 Tax=Spirosoma liriopis TaxID=2937440 RepID=A0ABT0HMC4_9BACT|nr:lipocalin family protein [Spirosoma liriopis]MCK8493308.1 lipocalin family protein [Spirosoma liriopis]